MPLIRISLAFVFMCAGHLAVVRGQDKPRQAATTVAEADADFAFQGEYVGKLGGKEPQDWGVQLIALGDGKFRLVGYPGGLPGAGFSPEGDRKTVELEAARQDGRVVFETTKEDLRIEGVIENGVLSIRAGSDRDLGSLKKVQRKSPTLGKPAPEGAVVLFDGSGTQHFRNARMTDTGLLMQGTTSIPTFQDFTLHLEFQLSYMPHARGQGRSNSGSYMQGRYEVQILDSFGLSGEHNECGGIYSVAAPRVNMCLPPLSWQTYDVEFRAARFDTDGSKTENARMTVHHNGVLVHDNVEVDHATTAAPLKEGPQPGPLYLQDHGNPVRFRNIWVVPKSSSAS